MQFPTRFTLTPDFLSGCDLLVIMSENTKNYLEVTYEYIFKITEDDLNKLWREIIKILLIEQQHNV